MKKVLLGMAVFCSAAAFGQTNKTYVIKGSVSGIKDTIKKVFLQYMAGDTKVVDSSMVTGGKFRFKGTVTEPIKPTVYLKFTNRPTSGGRDVISLFAQPGVTVTVTSTTDTFANAVIKGGAMNAEWKKITAGEKKYDDQVEPIYTTYADARKNKNKALADSLEKQMDFIDSVKTEEVYGRYIKAHPASPVAVFVLNDYAGYQIDADKIEPLFKTLPAAQQMYSMGKALKGKLEIAKLTGIGKPAPGFTQNDTLDRPVSLTNFKGKYVLLDFWASWCGPCRRENPNVVAAYNKYKDKGFSILSVSLDQPGAKEKWIKAIHDDNLTWTHVSDLQFWDNAVAKEYGIQSIPQNFLISPDGTIVGKDLRGEDLEKKLAGIFAN